MRGKQGIIRYKNGLAMLLVCLLLADCISHIAGTGMDVVFAADEQTMTVRMTLSSGEVVETTGDSLLEAAGGEAAAGEVMVLEILSGTLSTVDWGKIKYFSKLTEFLVSDTVTSEAVRLAVSNDDQLRGFFPPTLQKAEIPEGVTELGLNCFYQCTELEEIHIPHSVRTIGGAAFQSCIKLTNVTLPEGLRTIKGSAFNLCTKLKEINVPSTVTTIGTAAFWNCYELEKITLPASLREIGSIFRECKKLSRMDIVVRNLEMVTPVSADNDRFKDCPEERQIFFYNEKGIPLSHVTTPTLERATEAYHAVEDGDTSDTKWYGWEIGVEDPVYEVMVRTEGGGRTTMRVAGTVIAAGENAGHETLVRGEDLLELTFTPEEGCSLLSVTVNGEQVNVSDNSYIIAKPAENYSIAVSFSEKAALPTVEPAASPEPEPSVMPGPTADSTSQPSESPSPEPSASQSPSPEPPASQNPSLESPASPGPSLPASQSPAPTIPTASVSDKDISDIVNGLGVPGETAEKVQAVAKELDVSKDTILVTDKTILSQKTDKDIKGAYFARIQARVSQITQNNVKLVWNKIKGADGYLVYGNRCNTKKIIHEYKLLKTITNKNKKSYIRRKCKKGSYYKFIVRAYKNIDGKKVTIAVSKTIHVVTNGGKNGNAKAVRANKSKLSLKQGKTFRLKAKEVKQKKKLRYHREVCYESSNAKVASVTRKGMVKGKKKGKCTIFAYAQNGIYKKVNVTVK